MSREGVRAVLRHYELGPIENVEALGGAGGFSGASLWRLRAGTEVLCLRRWPPQHPRGSALRQIHAFLRHAAAGGLPVPAPRPTRDGPTWLHLDGRWWELSPWLPGRADYREHPTPGRLEAAAQTLARLHQAGAELQPPGLALPAIASERLGMLLDAPPLALQLTHQLDRLPPSLKTPAATILGAAVARSSSVHALLKGVAQTPVPRQIVLRDIWHDHLLFSGDQVSGVVDFGAMGVETVAADLARMLGSLCGDDREAWERGLEAYHRVRPLSLAERELAPTLDRAAVVLSGLNWLKWILLEGRQFPGREADIAQRLSELAQRIDRL